MRDMTVVLYVDADHGVATFVEEVTVAEPEDAFEAAVAQARGQPSMVRGHEWEHATEIAAFHGHGLSEPRDRT